MSLPWPADISWGDPFASLLAACSRVRAFRGLPEDAMVHVAVPAMLEDWTRQEWAERSDLDPHWIPSAWNQFFWSHRVCIVFVVDMGFTLGSDHFEALIYFPSTWVEGAR